MGGREGWPVMTGVWRLAQPQVVAGFLHGQRGGKDEGVQGEQGLWGEGTEVGLGHTRLNGRSHGGQGPPCPLFPPATLTVGIGRVVVEDAASGPVVAAQHDEMALVVGGAAKAAVATGGKAAVLDRAGAEVAVQHP